MDLKKIIEGLSTEIYKDGFKPAISEAGDALANVVKAARFLLSPIDIAAAYQTRFDRWIQKIATKVPPQNMIEAHPSIVGPTIEHLKWIDQDSILEEMFLNLLARSIDKNRVSEAHPAFSKLISQLSPDEAVILYNLKKNNEYKCITNKTAPKRGGSWLTSTLVSTEYPTQELIFSQNFLMYVNHLNSLSIIEIKHVGSEPIKTDSDPQIHVITEIIRLQEFGVLFCNACVPENWK